MKRLSQLVPLFAIIINTTFILSSCSILEILSKKAPTLEPVQGIKIDENDKACVSAQDCTLSWSDCSTCECGTPINKLYTAKYEQAYTDACSEYSGPVCEMSCPEVRLDCIDQVCTAIELEE